MDVDEVQSYSSICVNYTLYVHQLWASSNVVCTSILSVFECFPYIDWYIDSECLRTLSERRLWASSSRTESYWCFVIIIITFIPAYLCVLCFKTNNEWFTIHNIVLNSLMIYINNNTHYNLYAILTESYGYPTLSYALECFNLSATYIQQRNGCWNSVYRKIFDFKLWTSQCSTLVRTLL